MSNKKLFLDLVLEQIQKCNRPAKVSGDVGWENTIKEFKEEGYVI